ncbi:MAG: GHMP kinase [Candidatus Latescibacteria bacterium]|nr:GHMP kinase [Candidatus Latescibacterota bacterium]
MVKAQAFAPGNISCVFKIIPHQDPRFMHSLGLGFTVREGVRATLSRAGRQEILFNGRSIDFPTVSGALASLQAPPLRVDLQTPLPLSCGFGLSGAAALAVVHAADALLGLGRPREELAMAAHVAEVEQLTGLGDVCNQHHGGCLLKLVPGQPLRAARLAVPARPIYYRYFGPIHTRQVLADPQRRARINQAADQALEILKGQLEVPQVDFEACIRLSRVFADQSGLLADERVVQAIAQIEATGGAGSMIMLGNAVFSNRPFAQAQETALCAHQARVLG